MHSVTLEDLRENLVKEETRSRLLIEQIKAFLYTGIYI